MIARVVRGDDAEIAELQVQLARIEDGNKAYERSEGFSNNDGRVPNPIPIGNGLSVPAKWVRQRSDTQVELLAGLEEGEHRYVVELYATPNYSLDTPADATPIWLLQLL